MSTGYLWHKEHAAVDLARLLRHARLHIATTRPRVCCDCAHCFTVSSAASPLRCWRCGLAAVSDDVPADAPGQDCPDHGPSESDCDKC